MFDQQSYLHEISSINKMLAKESVNRSSRNFAHLFVNPYSLYTSVAVELETTEQRSFYGLHPEVSTYRIKQQILADKSCFDSNEDLFEFMRSSPMNHLWTLHQSDGFPKEALFAKTLLAMASFFYFDIWLEAEIQEEFQQILRINPQPDNPYRFSFMDVYPEQSKKN